MVYIEENTNLVQFFEIERFISKKQTKQQSLKYLVRWKKYESEYDACRNISELGDIAQYLKNSEDRMKIVATLIG